MQRRTIGTKAVSEIAVGPTNPANVAGMDRLHPISAHEQAHRYENVVQDVMALEDLFLTRRTSLLDGTLERVQRYSASVNVRADHFSEKYTGRRYKSGATELLSTGVEAVFAGQIGDSLASAVAFRTPSCRILFWAS